MRSLRTLVPILALLVGLLVAVPASASTSTTYKYSVSGTEVYATSTEGVFSGVASGSGTGTWYADVLHTPLGVNGASITGGSFGMALATGSLGPTVSGRVTGGSIGVVHSGSNCTDQVYTVASLSGPVSAGGGTGSGYFTVTLTHHRKSLFGRCWIYAATVTGSVTLIL